MATSQDGSSAQHGAARPTGPLQENPGPEHTQDTSECSSSPPWWRGGRWYRRGRGRGQVPPIRHPLEESVVWSFLVALVTLAAALALAVPVLCAMALILPMAWTARYLTELLGSRARCCKHGCDPHLRMVCPNDAQWIADGQGESEQELPSVMHAVLVFEGGMDMSQFRQLLLSRVVNAENPNGTKLYPRFSQRVVSGRAAFRWESHLAFNICDHVVQGPCLRDEAQLQAYVAELLAEALSSSRPLWEVRVLHDYGPCRDTAVVLRVHQCVADGMSLVRILCHSLADQQVLHIPQRPHFAGLSFSLNVIRALLIGPLTMACWWGQSLLLRHRCRTSSNGLSRPGHRKQQQQKTPVPPQPRAVAWSAGLTVSKVLRVKQVTRSTLNDVLLAAVAGSVREYLKKKGTPHPRNLKMVLPVDLRNEVSSAKQPVSKLGWKVAGLLAWLPCGVEGAVPRLWTMRRLLEEVRSSADPAVAYGAAPVLSAMLPHRLARVLLRAPQALSALQFSSLPGPGSTLLVGGHPLKAVYPLLPPPGPRTLAVAIFTYADHVHITVLARGTRAPRFLLSTFLQQVEQLSDLLAHRRVPGEVRRVLSSRRDDFSRPPLQEIHLKLYYVQEELHKLTQRLDQLSLCEDEDNEEIIQDQADLKQRLQILKDEFSALLAELRRRTSLSEDAVTFEDEEVDGSEFRRPRKRALSATSLRRLSVASHSHVGHQPAHAQMGCSSSSSFSSGMKSALATPSSPSSRKSSLVSSSATVTPASTSTMHQQQHQHHHHHHHHHHHQQQLEASQRQPRRKSCPSTAVHRITTTI